MMQPTTLHAQKRARQQQAEEVGESVGNRKFVNAMVDAEQDRQITKFGAEDNGDGKWLAILAEEFGEVATALLEHNLDDLRKELTQVAAVAQSWLGHRL